MKVRKKGQSLELIGIQPIIGECAPKFSLKDLNDHTVHLSDYLGEPVLISVIPDIDTRVCSLQTKYFNQEAASIKGIHFMTISNNSKEEQENWCAAAGVDMEILRDTENQFGKAYGLFIPEIGRLARAIFVVDKNGRIIYQAISEEVSEEPDYQAAIAAAEKARSTSN